MYRRQTSRTPPGQGSYGNPTTIKPAARKTLQDMTSEERGNWLAAQQAELEDFATYAQTYLKGREASGRQTQTDDRYHQFLERAADQKEEPNP